MVKVMIKYETKDILNYIDNTHDKFLALLKLPSVSGVLAGPTKEINMEDSKYAVFDKNNNLICYINKYLAEEHAISDTQLDEIKKLHRHSHTILSEMEKTDDYDELNYLFWLWEKTQYSLQVAWGFPEDRGYHKFWTVPKCSCPRLDNEERYPLGNYVVNTNCKVHGLKNGVKASDIS